MTAEDRVRLAIKRLKPGLEEMNIRAIARAAHCDVDTATVVMQQMIEDGEAYVSDKKWYGPNGGQK